MQSSKARLLACLIPGLLAVGVSQTWFRPGYVVATGDLAPPLRQAWWGSFASHWNDDLTGSGAPSYEIVHLPEIVATNAFRALGLDDGAAQRLWISFLYGAAALAIAYLALGLGAAPIGAGIAGLLGVLNFYFLQILPSPVLLVALITAGVAGGLIVRAARELRRGRAVAVAVSTLGVGYVFINPPLVAVLIAWFLLMAIIGLLIGGEGAGRRLFRLVVSVFPLAILVNAWWSVPAFLTRNGSGSTVTATTFAANTDILAWAWTHERASLGNLIGLGGTWAWGVPGYFPFAPRLDSFPFVGFRYVLPEAALLAPLAVRKEHIRTVIALTMTALAAIWIGKGLHQPLPQINLFLYHHIPGFWLFREPMSKALIVVFLCYAILAGFTLQRLFDAGSRLARGGAVLGVGLMLAAVYPLVTGEFISDRRPLLGPEHVRVPLYWKQLAGFVNRQPLGGKVLVLPLDDFYQVPTTWGYYGADLTAPLLIRRPVLAELPAGYFVPPPRVRALYRYIENEVLAANLSGVSRIAADLGARFILVRHDIDLDFPGRSFADPVDLAKELRRTPGIHFVRSFGLLDLFTVEQGTEVFAAGRVIPSRGSPTTDALAQVSAGTSFVDGAAVPPLVGATPSRVTYDRPRPALFRLHVAEASGPYLIGITETYAPGWRLIPARRSTKGIHHVRVNGYANGWIIPRGGSLDARIEYSPEKFATIAKWVSLVTVFLLVAALALSKRWARVRVESSWDSLDQVEKVAPPQS